MVKPCFQPHPLNPVIFRRRSSLITSASESELPVEAADSDPGPESEVEISDLEDGVLVTGTVPPKSESVQVLTIGQPQDGWTTAERLLYGNPKHWHSARKTPQTAYYHRQKEKKKEKENTEVQKNYGKISRFFVRSESPTTFEHQANNDPYQVLTMSPSIQHPLLPLIANSRGGASVSHCFMYKLQRAGNRS